MTQAITRIVLARRPHGMPAPDDFRIEEASLPDLRDGEALIAKRILAMDPAIRGFLDDRPSYLPPVAIGEMVRGMTLGEVIASRNPALPEGIVVRALSGWASHAILAADALGLEPIAQAPGVPLNAYMGLLGPSGFTAWIGLNVIGHGRPGDTVLVSAAAGAVGSVVCQLARNAGCTVVAIAGSAAKCAQLNALGIETTVDYRAAPDLGAALAVAAPKGFDVYFDNVGGQTLETVLPLMREQGRVVVCGMIADYNDQDAPYPVRALWQFMVKRLTMRGFLTYDHAEHLARRHGAGQRRREWHARRAPKLLRRAGRGSARVHRPHVRKDDRQGAGAASVKPRTFRGGSSGSQSFAEVWR